MKRALYLGEWIRVRVDNRLCAGRPCSGCKRVGGRVPVWCSIKTGEVRCLKCFDAEAEHYRQEDAWAADRRRRRRLEA
jgi:hypothetical protein